tara:strand:+ start:2225 stop:3976 length:1752 start_codon:yes stop_codon:yes gene_type:complete
MAEYLHFSRDSRLYLEKDGYVWSIPVLDGFSFSQATNASEVTLNEMEDSTGRSRRGRKMFTDSLSAAEWSFSTYARPFLAGATSGGTDDHTGTANMDTTAQVHAVEEALWVAMAGQNVYNRAASKFTHGTNGGSIASFTAANASADADLADAQYGEGTYSFNVGSGQNSTGITYSGAGVNAVVSVKVAGSGASAAITFTETGQKFKSGETIVIDGDQLGGSGTRDDITVTLYAETMIQYTAAAVDAQISPDGTPAKTVSSPGATPTYANAGTASDRSVINFTDSNRSALGTFNLYFILSDRSEGRLIYKLENAVVNEAGIDFDIDGISTINWSGMAGQIKDVTSLGAGVGKWTAKATAPTTTAVGEFWIDTANSDRVYISRATSGTSIIGVSSGTHWQRVIEEGTTDTGNFIRNRLTQLTLAPETVFQAGTTFTNASGSSDSYETSYQVALTGGSVTISNNISYLTPEELGKVNQPIEHITGTRTVAGSLTCYLGSSDVATNKVSDLFKDLVADNNTVINKFAITLQVGGTGSGPKLELSLPLSHLEIPSHSIEDVISVETNFSGLGSGIGESDEIKVTYKAA